MSLSDYTRSEKKARRRGKKAIKSKWIVGKLIKNEKRGSKNGWPAINFIIHPKLHIVMSSKAIHPLHIIDKGEQRSYSFSHSHSLLRCSWLNMKLLKLDEIADDNPKWELLTCNHNNCKSSFFSHIWDEFR